MFKKQLISFLKFALIWLVFSFSIGSFDHLNERPRGVHQGAQCDRASLALNFYHNGMRFLYPEVHENRCKDGIVSCELPLSNYLSACLYKVFGFNEKWFRLLTFSFVSIGMFALFLLLKLYVRPLVAYMLLFIINSSPIVLFYATNFIPDASALGLVLIAWYLFFKLFIPHPYLPNLKNNGFVFLFIISLSLATASKSTCIIQWMSMCGVLLFSYIKGLKIELANRKKLFISLSSALVIPVLWQLWAHHLGDVHNSEFFMMHIPTVNSMAEYKEAWHVYLANWPMETFHQPLHFIVAIMLLLPFFIKKHVSQNLWYITVFNTLGSFLFVAIMIRQFMYHDYYILCILPCIIINWIVIASWIVKLRSDYWALKITIFVGILIAFIHQYKYGKSSLEWRYTEGHYWEQSQQKTIDYTNFKIRINQLGVDRKQCVLVGYDGAPDNVLYLLDLYGKRINNNFSDEQIRESIVEMNPSYLVSNDSLFTERVKPLFKGLKPVVSYKYLNLFKIER